MVISFFFILARSSQQESILFLVVGGLFSQFSARDCNFTTDQFCSAFNITPRLTWTLQRDAGSNLSVVVSSSYMMATLPGTVPRMVRPAPGQNYPRTGFPLEGKRDDSSRVLLRELAVAVSELVKSPLC